MQKFKRKITDEILKWKILANHKPLYIKGARQIGKTESTKDFIINNYKSFKLYFLDSGLLLSTYGKEVQQKILTGELGIKKGAIYENVFARFNKVFYLNDENDSLKLDFVFETDKINTAEIKSGNNKSNSINQLIELIRNNKKYKDVDITKFAYVNLGINDFYRTLPLYMIMFY